MNRQRSFSGAIYPLTVMSAIRRGRTADVRAAIQRLPTGPGSPLAAIGGLHTLRLLVLDTLVHQGPSQPPDRLASDYLVLTATFDGTLDAFVGALARHLPREADSWWQHCYDYPCTSDRARFAEWISRHQVHTALFAAAAPRGTVRDIHESLALRERLLAFAIEAQGLDAVELQQRFRQRFTAALSDRIGATRATP